MVVGRTGPAASGSSSKRGRKRKLPKILSPEEVARLLDACDNGTARGARERIQQTGMPTAAEVRRTLGPAAATLMERQQNVGNVPGQMAIVRNTPELSTPMV